MRCIFFIGYVWFRALKTFSSDSYAQNLFYFSACISLSSSRALFSAASIISRSPGPLSFMPTR